MTSHNPASSNPTQWRGLRGFLLDTPAPGRLRAIRDGAVLLRRNRIYDAGEFERLCHLPEAREIKWEFGPGSLIVPGLIDLHGHLPQYPAVARPEQSLQSWYEGHIFPLERNFNAATARRSAPDFFTELARHGITQSVLSAASYAESCDATLAAAEASGLRVILGNVMMDRGQHGSPAPDRAGTTAVEESARLIRKWHGRDNGRIEYAVTPLSAVACTREMLEAAARLAREHGTYVQTHLSENTAEIARVAELFPEAADYTGVYESAGLLGPRTILAHCLHLSDREIAVLADTGSIVAHCPTSNLFLRSGILPWERLRKAGIPIGVGHDVAGGPELNTWQVLRSALESQVARSFFQPCPVPSLADLFYQATQGAAEALGKAGQQGSIEIGKSADLVVIDLASLLPGPRRRHVEADLSAEDLVCLLVHRAGPQNTVATLVRGRTIYLSPPPSLL